MGLLFIKELEGAALGVWEITETLSQLEKAAVLTPDEVLDYECLKTPLRKKHWLSYRLITPHLSTHLNPTGISYDAFGKPHPNDRSGFLSVAHSGKFSVMIASRAKPVGVDIEHIHPKIRRVSHKFLSKEEIAWLGPDPGLESLYLIWGAKESLFKLHGKGQLGFSEQLHIEPFVYTGSGVAHGHMSTKEGRTAHLLHYDTIDDYVLVYTVFR